MFLRRVGKEGFEMAQASLQYCCTCSIAFGICTVEGIGEKVGFLKKLLSDEVGVGAVAVNAMVDDVELWCLVKECRELEECTGLNFTDIILTQPEMVGLKEVKSTVRRVCWEKVLKKCEESAPLIARLERMVGWGKLWNMVMDLGEKHIVTRFAKLI